MQQSQPLNECQLSGLELRENVCSVEFPRLVFFSQAWRSARQRYPREICGRGQPWTYSIIYNEMRCFQNNIQIFLSIALCRTYCNHKMPCTATVKIAGDTGILTYHERNISTA